MALVYRVVSFGRPNGPWRGRRQQAELDAVQAGVGEYDEWNQLYLEAFAEIEWMRLDDIKLSA